jgi:hypothetical protein
MSIDVLKTCKTGCFLVSGSNVYTTLPAVSLSISCVAVYKSAIVVEIDQTIRNMFPK